MESLMQSFRVVCINDANRPDGIPTNKWVVKDRVYTVIEVAKLRVQGGLLGFKLEEINIDSCFPYQYFAANRFRIPVEIQHMDTQAMLDKLLEEAKRESVTEPVLV